MNCEIPDSLEDLHLANSKPNPVNIAGYGRESTHKGYLSWILSTDRNPFALDLISSLNGTIEMKNDLSRTINTFCYFEQKIGKHRIDLLIALNQMNSDFKEKYLPIELKTDSGPSGEKQFTDMSSFIESDKKYLRGYVFCLGSSYIQSHDWNNFRVVTPEDLVEKWKQYYDKAPSFLRDWLDMVAIEIARKKLAVDVFSYNVRNKDSFWNFGYRNYKHLMYYVYSEFRKYLEKRNCAQIWDIYDGSHNAVMNLSKGEESWIYAKGIKNVRWLFEFNDNKFCLKLEHLSDENEAFLAWVMNTKKLLQTVDSDFPIKINNRKITKKGWPTLGKWEIDFTDFEQLEKQVKCILNDYGVNGIMGAT